MTNAQAKGGPEPTRPRPRFQLYETLWGAIFDKAFAFLLGVAGYFVGPSVIAVLSLPFVEFDVSEFARSNWPWCLAIGAISVAVIAGLRKRVAAATILFALAGASTLVLSVPTGPTRIIAGPSEIRVFGGHMDLDFVLYFAGLLFLFLSVAVPVARSARHLICAVVPCRKPANSGGA